ncbi:cytochrome P450 [Streptomyces sp. NPDC020681]|uniref:cytochrome P450 n=1 Tax=Streptomyces sp. NPDC020681 TaxID=3365083 RepID=UPI0037BD1BA7
MQTPVTQYGGPGLPVWRITGHRLIRSLLADPRLTPSHAAASEKLRAMCPHADVWGAGLSGALNRADGAEYIRLRSMFGRAFSPTIVSRLRSSTTGCADMLIAGFAERGHAELIADYIRPLAVITTLDLLGVPGEDRREVARLFTAGTDAQEEARAYFTTALPDLGGWIGCPDSPANIHGAPGLISLLAQLEGDGLKLTHDELHAAFLLLLGTGATLTDVLSGALLHVVADESTSDKFRAQTTGGALSVKAVNELLRYTYTGRDVLIRFATEPLSIDGQAISAGDAVLFDIAAANRDPSAFAEPDELRPDRTLNPHLSFGQGPHNCLGAAVARTQIGGALGALLSQLPRLRPADAATWPADGAPPTELHVEFS